MRYLSSQSHVSHCRVLPLGEFTVMIPEPHATLHGAVTWRYQCHRATLQGVIVPSAIVFAIFFNAVWALTAALILSAIHMFVISLLTILRENR